jgi:hypothetical protein
MAFDANNKMKSSMRLLFDKSSYNVDILKGAWQTKKIKDFLSDEKMFYGRVNRNNDPVFPRRRNLKFVGSADSTIRAHGFVAAAFNALASDVEDVLIADRSGRRLSEFFPLKPKKGYVDPSKEYVKYIDSIAQRFTTVYMKREERRRQITDYSTFLPFFIDYLTRNARDTPITLSSFLLSHRCSVLSSGLAIEVYDGDYSDDQVKNRLFFSNPNFELYKNLAYYHGFVIDKHIPWRLVADINSPNMRKHMSTYYPSGPQTVFFLGYEEAYRQEVSSLIKMSVSFYNVFAERYPVDQDNRCSTPKIILRSTIDVNTALSRLPYSGWVRVFASLRNIETGMNYSDAEMRTILASATGIQRKVDTPSALRYINNKFNAVEQYAGSLFYDVVRREASRDPKSSEESVRETIKRSVQISKLKT